MVKTRTSAINVVDEAPESCGTLRIEQPGKLDSQDTNFPAGELEDDAECADPMATERQRSGVLAALPYYNWRRIKHSNLLELTAWPHFRYDLATGTLKAASTATSGQYSHWSLSDIQSHMGEMRAELVRRRDVSQRRLKQLSGPTHSTRLGDIAEIMTSHPNPHFWIQRNGSDRTVGKPVKQIERSDWFGVRVKPGYDPDEVYTAVYAMWQRRYFMRYAVGSLNLKHIRKKDIASVPLHMSGGGPNMAADAGKGNSLQDLTDRETAVTSPMNPYRDWSESYSNEDTSEDLDKLGMAATTPNEHMRLGLEESAGHVEISLFERGGLRGFIEATLFPSPHATEDLWKVDYVNANQGYGPMLYDMAMEYVTRKGGQLMADRERVTNAAAEVWEKYLGQRDDVIPTPLPFEMGLPVADDSHQERVEASLQFAFRKPAAVQLEWFERRAAERGDDYDVKSRPPVVCVDLDGTLVYDVDYGAAPLPSGQPAIGEALRGAGQAMKTFQELGWHVIVFTARFSKAPTPAAKKDYHTEIEQHLQKVGIPFDEIAMGSKPIADVYIDNKAKEFEGDWYTVIQEVTTDSDIGTVEEPEMFEIEGTDQFAPNDWTDYDESRVDRAIPRPADTESMKYL